LWSRADVLERCALPVEGVRGPVLLVSGGDDGLWPAAVGAAHLARRLAARGVPVRHLNYPGAGHAIGVPNEAQPFVALRAWRDGYFGVEDGLIDVGGDPAGAARAARSSWREAVAFLSDALR
jgi:acetyl esterase/lipase